MERLLRWLSGKESACQCRRHGFDPWSGKIPLAAEQLNLCPRAREPRLLSPVPQLLEPAHPGACVPQQEKPPL